MTPPCKTPSDSQLVAVDVDGFIHQVSARSDEDAIPSAEAQSKLLLNFEAHSGNKSKASAVTAPSASTEGSGAKGGEGEGLVKKKQRVS